MANNQKAGRTDQSEQPPNPHRGGVCRLQEDDQTDLTTVGEKQILFKGNMQCMT